jgi:pimeloyl-ACP methyl ester carboxylesterase
VTFNDLPGAEHASCRVAGVRIHWAELGPRGSDEKAPPVVLLHGLHDCHRTWRRVATELARRGRRVLVPDLAGHGRSERPDASYTLQWHTDVMGAWLDAMQVGPADVVGHSLGGGVAQMFLLAHRHLLRRVVLVAPGGLGREITPLLRLAALPLVVERLGQPVLPIGARVALRGLLDREDRIELARLNALPGSARAFARTVQDLIDLRGQRRSFFQRAHELADDLPPISVIWGTRDGVIPVRHARALGAVLDGVPVTLLDGCGHYVHQDEPERFVAALRVCLDGIAPGTRFRVRPHPPIVTSRESAARRSASIPRVFASRAWSLSSSLLGSQSTKAIPSASL